MFERGMPVIEMSIFVPKLALLPPPQRQLWPELDATPRQFTLYGGTALALRLGHRESVDFDFFSRQPFEPNQLAENKDYLDIDALLQNGVTLPTALAAGQIVYGSRFNPVITLKALSYFDDLPTLPAAVKARLSAAAARVDLNQLPVLSPCPSRHPHHGSQS